MLRRGVLALVAFGVFSSCVETPSGNQAYDAVGRPTLSQVSVSENFLILSGSHLDFISQVTLNGLNLTAPFTVLSQSESALIATPESELHLSVSTVYELKLTNDNGSFYFYLSTEAQLPEPYKKVASPYYWNLWNSGIGSQGGSPERLDIGGDLFLRGQASTPLTETPQAMVSLLSYNYGIAKKTSGGLILYSSHTTDLSLGVIRPNIPWPYSGGGNPYLLTEAYYSDSLLVHSSGRIGIHTPTPDEELTVSGGTALSSPTPENGSLLIRTPTSPTLTDLSVNPAGRAGEISGHGSQGTTNDSGFLRLSAGGGTQSSFKTLLEITGSFSEPEMDRTLRFARGSTEWARLDSNGHLGIRSDSPKAFIDVRAVNTTVPQFAFTSSSGGYRHFIRTRHSTDEYLSGNGIDFFLNNSATPQASLAPDPLVGSLTTNQMSLSVTAAGVGIFSRNPQASLDVQGTVHLPALNATEAPENAGSQVLIGETTQVPSGEKADLTIAQASTATLAPFLVAGSKTPWFQVKFSGTDPRVIIGSTTSDQYPLQVSSTGSDDPTKTVIKATGKFKCLAKVSTSDRRLKEEIEPISEATAQQFLERSNPVSFRWKKNQKKTYGFIAQDWLAAEFPLLVHPEPAPEMKEERDPTGIISPAQTVFTIRPSQTQVLLLAATKVTLQKSRDQKKIEQEGFSQTHHRFQGLDQRLQETEVLFCRHFPEDPECR
ncbi:MAG: tail fiber domain-containing protein [Bdellovibrionia bacterium]